MENLTDKHFKSLMRDSIKEYVPAPDWLGKVFVQHQRDIGYVRLPCYGNGIGYLWLSLLEHKTGSAICHEIRGHSMCHFNILLVNQTHVTYIM